MTRKPKILPSAKEIRMLTYLQERETMVVPVSIREIAEAMGITSTSVVNYHLEQLEKLGKIKRTDGAARFIKLVHDDKNLSQPKNQ